MNRILLMLLTYLGISYSSTIFGFISDNSVILSSSGSLDINNVNIKTDFEWIRPIGTSSICVGLQGNKPI